MASANELFQRACINVARTPTPDLDLDTRRIWMLIGALSDAFWRRVGEPGFSIFERLCQNEKQYLAESEDEIAIWNELTAPHNYPAVVRYVAHRKGQISEYAAQLHYTILEAARKRFESGANDAASPNST